MAIKTVKDFERIKEAFTDDALLKKTFPEAKPRLVPFLNDQMEEARLSLIHANLKNPSLPEIIQQSFDLHPKKTYLFGTSGVEEYTIAKARELHANGDDLRTNLFLYNLSLFESSRERDLIQGQVLPKIWGQMDFNEAYEFLRRNLRNITTVKPIEILVEEKARTNEDLDKLVAIKDDISKLAMSPADFGSVVLLDGMQKGFFNDRLELLKAALRTYETTKPLEQVIEKELKKAVKILKKERDSYDEDSNPEGPISESEAFWEHILGRNLREDDVESVLETILEPELKYKYSFVRLALADADNGVLVKEESRKELARAITDTLVEKTEEKIRGIAEDVLDSLIRSAPLHISYFTLVPLMLDKALLRPGKEDRKRLSPTQFVLEAAKNLGSPGVRFLQLLGQYVDIPSEQAKEFQKVYDNLHGQSKLTAYQTVTREVPDFKERYGGLEKAIGGGSLTTVYLAPTLEGERHVVKVLNPNLRYMNDISFQVVQEALRSLSEKNPRYAFGAEIINEIKEWVDKDIDFSGFLPRDAKFRKKHNDSKGPQGYRIMVPRSYGPENKHVKFEEFVDGTNLTNWEELIGQGHNMRAIVATIAQNYLIQLKNGLVHSDVHPGNFRVTADKKVAILDRNFYLEPSLGSRLMYGRLIGYAQNAQATKMARELASHVNLSPDLLKGLESAIGEEFGSPKPMTDQLLGVVRYLKENKVRIPIETTLVVRNLHALQKFSESAGFDSLKDALEYR